MVNLPPTGTVTFLFTDVEGSTTLHEDYPNRMQAALVRHDEILRSCIESHQGYVFKTLGDAFCAAFNTAKEAIQATLAAQRTLLAEQWPENVELRVRMGLHTGVAEESEGDYFGPPVNRVARLMSTGHGGQVLLSDATHNLVRDDLVYIEHEAKLHYLGEHRLKDLRYTERIFQLLVPDLPKEFEPLRTHGLVTPEEITNLDRRYRRIRYLGGGGFGNVYLVRHEALDRNMALKVLGRQYAEDEQFKERFKREAKSAAKLNHPNIVQVYDAGEGLFEEQKASYITMEYVPGGTLEDLIAQQGGPLPARTATELTLQVAKALDAAHRNGVIHRDIKPQNILLTESGEAKVADFGIARAIASSTKLTRTGHFMGTLHYMSPEQANGQPASPRSDLYSLGVVLYQALTGQLPFDAETPAAIMVKHITEPLHPPKEVNPDVPEGINGVCVRLLAKNPDGRYPDSSALIKDLERVQHCPEGAASAKTVLDEEDAAFAETIPDEEDPAFAQTIPPGRTEAPSTVEVPDLSGQDAAQADNTLANVGLKLGATEKASSETVPEGEITRQSLEAGTKVEPNTLISVTVSTGAPTVEVPDLAGQTLIKAGSNLSKLVDAGLKLGSRNEAPSDTVTKGKITKQDPAAGMKVKRGSSVSVTVSSGPERARTTGHPEHTGSQHRQQAEQARARERQRAGQAQHRRQVEPERKDRRKPSEAVGAVAAVVAGVAWIAVGLLIYDLAAGLLIYDLLILDLLGGSGSLFSVLNLLLFNALIGTLGGLVGLHARQRVSYGRLGMASFLLAFVWTALLIIGVGAVAVGAVGLSVEVGVVVAVEVGVTGGVAGGVVVIGVVRAVLVAVAAALGLYVGLALMGIATLRAGALPRWCGWLLIIGAAGSFLFGGLVLGPVWLALGYALWTRRGAPDG